MGFFDKVKNMFTEEVEEEVKVEQIKKDVTHVSIESPNVNKFENIGDEVSFGEDLSNKPVFFDDNDFEDLNIVKRREEKAQEKNIYTKKIEDKYIEEKKEEPKKVFKPTPIISPVYGILDKNYHKEDIVTKKDISKTAYDNEPSVESIRNKAYGTLEDELENTLFGNNSVLFRQDEKEESNSLDLEKIDEDAISNLTNDISKELDELLSRKEKYLEKDDNKKEELTDDLLDFIDSTLYKEGDED